MMAVLAAQCGLGGFHPLAVSFFGAAYAQNIWRIPLFMLSALSVWYEEGLVNGSKYVMVMAAIAAIITIAECMEPRKWRRAPVSDRFLMMITGCVLGAMECTDVFLEPFAASNLMTAIGVGIVAAGSAYFFQRGIVWLMEPVRPPVLPNEAMVSVAMFSAMITCVCIRLTGGAPGWLAAVGYVLLLAVSYRYGAAAGTMTGMLCGLMAGYLLQQSELAIGCAAAGCLAGSVRKLGRTGVLACGLMGVAAMYGLGAAWVAEPSFLVALAAGSAVFLCFPFGWGEKKEKEVFLANRNDGRDEMLRTSVNRKMMQTMESFRLLASTLRKDVYWDTSASGTAALSQACVRQDDLQAWNQEKKRLQSMWSQKLRESRAAVADQMNEVSEMVEACIREEDRLLAIPEEVEDQMWEQFRREGMILKKVMAIEQKNGRKKVIIQVEAGKRGHPTARQAAAICGKLLGIRLVLEENTLKYIAKEETTLYLNEEASFRAIFGTAGSKRSGETVSGDNFGHVTLADGRVLFSLSDGAGSGEQANGESASLLELLEQFLESGLSCEHALNMINSVMSIKEDGQHATADVGIVDLYTGMCHLVKMGAAATFIRRDHFVEVIGCSSLPLGLVESPRLEQSLRKLYDGDVIVMVTDGLLEAVGGANPEQRLCEYISDWNGSRPKDLAEGILAFCGGDGRDDCTVLAASIWEKKTG